MGVGTPPKKTRLQPTSEGSGSHAIIAAWLAGWEAALLGRTPANSEASVALTQGNPSCAPSRATRSMESDCKPEEGEEGRKEASS